MLTYDKNGNLKKDAPEASNAKKPKIGGKVKSIGETREARLAKVSQTVKSSFEGDLERLTQEIHELRGGEQNSLPYLCRAPW